MEGNYHEIPEGRKQDRKECHLFGIGEEGVSGIKQYEEVVQGKQNGKREGDYPVKALS